MQIVKFGGKSLHKNLEQVIEIIKRKSINNHLAVVVSAIGDTTDTLEKLLNAAKYQENYIEQLELFKNRIYHSEIELTQEFEQLSKLLEGVFLLEDYNLKIKDQVLAFGELISSKIVAQTLNEIGIKSESVDSRNFIITDKDFGNAQVKEELSKEKTIAYFTHRNQEIIPIITGFIGSTEQGETTTLGRNGSNYSASLLANFLQADELQNYTHVDGIFTANPDWVKDAQKIEELHFDDANELAVFGTSVLHAKTILPLVENKIPLRILNTLNPENQGTLISSKKTAPGIKALSIQSDVALIQLEGRGLLSTIGIDARVFGSLAYHGISVGVISQGSSERGLGFVVPSDDAGLAIETLHKEFQGEIYRKDVDEISVRTDIAVVSIVGLDLGNFDKAYAALVKNKIIPILFNNAVSGKNVSLIIEKNDAKKAINVIHGQIFGVSKKINIAIFGHGSVGGTLINQILESSKTIENRKNIKLNIFAIGNSKKVVFDENGLNTNWKTQLENEGTEYNINSVIEFANQHHLENLIAVDNTASSEFIENYTTLVENGFDLISSNKIGNTVSFDFYKKLRNTLKLHHKEYLYETNVGAGLPLIDTIKLLHLSGESITKIKGVFSGSLSYIFNTFSGEDRKFSDILRDAINKGFTEPDPREDLSGNDVGRKLLVLARELDLCNEFDEIEIQNLIPENLQTLSTKDFLESLPLLDHHYDQLKDHLDSGKVYRYIGEISGNLQEEKGILKTQLVEVAQDSSLGSLKGSDSIFEIYTESYGENPIIIQGAGAGASVTARGVFGDILRLVGKID